LASVVMIAKVRIHSPEARQFGDTGKRHFYVEGHQRPESQTALRNCHEERAAVRDWWHLGELERTSGGLAGGDAIIQRLADALIEQTTIDALDIYDILSSRERPMALLEDLGCEWS
jgi:hypothetical protein